MHSSKKLDELKKSLEIDETGIFKLPNINSQSFTPDRSSVLSFPNSSVLSVDKDKFITLNKANKENRNSINFSLQNNYQY